MPNIDNENRLPKRYRKRLTRFCSCDKKKRQKNTHKKTALMPTWGVTLELAQQPKLVCTPNPNDSVGAYRRVFGARCDAKRVCRFNSRRTRSLARSHTRRTHTRTYMHWPTFLHWARTWRLSRLSGVRSTWRAKILFDGVVAQNAHKYKTTECKKKRKENRRRER